MKTSLWSLAALAFMLMGCGNAGDNEKQNLQPQVIENETPNSDELLFDVDEDVDWERPLFALNKEGDTVEKWSYNEMGQLISDDLEESDGFSIYEGYGYDERGRLIRYGSSSFTGNRHEDNVDYTYNGNVRTGMGMHITEGYPFYIASKEVCYFMDEDFKYDTLCEEYSAEVSWDDDNDDDTYAEGQLKLERYTTKKYRVINGETKLAEERFYCVANDDPDAFLLGYRETYDYNSQGLLVSVVHHAADGKETVFDHHYFGNVMDSLTYFARKSQFKPLELEYVEPKENIVQKAAEQLLPEEYVGGVECQSKTVATVPVDDGETETIACYQRGDGSWLVLEYWPTQGPENDKLSVYVLGRDGKLEPSDAQNLPLNLEGMRLLGNQLFFTYQGDALQFGNDYFVFPMEDGEPLRLEWNGEQFVVE